eukprot:5653097-Alexandrium_andersonii.AAC.1
MSASLVGSEMCIRDSSTAGGLRARPPLASPACRAPRLGGGPSATRPVSYTHLTLPTICSV